MKILRPLLAALALLLCVRPSVAAAEPHPDAAPLRVMSFNVRQSGAHDGPNGWAFRRAVLLDVVTRFAPSLVGFQEVLADQYDEITARLSGYTFVGVAREDGRRKGEWAMIGFRRDRFTALDQGNFWLSEHPEIPGSKSWRTAYTRLCTWVRLRDRLTGREFLYANTHLDNESALAREQGCRLIARRLPELARGNPILLTGDFNMHEGDPAFAPLVQPTEPGAIALIDSYREVHPTRSPDEASFHGFSGTVAGSRIDFIFHSPQFAATAADIDRTRSADGHWPSDHYAVTAILRWR